MKGSFTKAMELSEPERTKYIAKNIKPTKIYPVFNPGSPIPVRYQGELLEVPSGESEWPEEFAYWLLCKYNFLKSPADKSKKNLLDGREYAPEPIYDFIETFPEIIPAYDDITAKEITAWLGKLEVPIEAKAKKKELYAQLVAQANDPPVDPSKPQEPPPE